MMTTMTMKMITTSNASSRILTYNTRMVKKKDSDQGKRKAKSLLIGSCQGWQTQKVCHQCAYQFNSFFPQSQYFLSGCFRYQKIVYKFSHNYKTEILINVKASLAKRIITKTKEVSLVCNKTSLISCTIFLNISRLVVYERPC